jgi:hypothetical protein
MPFSSNQVRFSLDLTEVTETLISADARGLPRDIFEPIIDSMPGSFQVMAYLEQLRKA